MTKALRAAAGATLAENPALAYRRANDRPPKLSRSAAQAPHCAARVPVPARAQARKHEWALAPRALIIALTHLTRPEQGVLQ
jgi:hypothetical protein